MDIVITFSQNEPPAGTAGIGLSSGMGRTQVTFVGWLGLLEALSELLGATGGDGHAR